MIRRESQDNSRCRVRQRTASFFGGLNIHFGYFNRGFNTAV
jgi:hypothetical protein